MRTFKRFIYGMHRVLGTILSILFMMWFLSGFVMIYHSFPKVKSADRFRVMEALSDDFMDNDSLQTFLSGKSIRHLSLKMNYHRPVFQISTPDTSFLIPNTGQTQEKDLEQLSTYAQLWCDAPIQKVDTLYKLDQWIPFGRLKKDMPIYKIHFADEMKHRLYVSSRSGEALQFTDKENRFWAWFGAIPHWIYFTSLRQNAKLWSNTIVVLCIAGIAMCIAGIILGIRSYVIIYRKRKQFKSPYHRPMYKWHHIAGFFFGLFVLTFTFSGMMSLISIPDWMVKTHDKSLGRRITTEYPIELEKYKLDFKRITEAYPSEVKSVEWGSFGDIPFYKVVVGNKAMVFDASSDSISPLELTENDIRRKFEDIHGEAVKITLMTEFDNYYLARKMKLALPVYKVEANDADGSVSYVNPYTGATRYYNHNSRANKWAYRALHAYSIKFLIERPILWNIVMWTTMIGGTVVSFTGLYLSFKYIRRKIRTKKKRC